MLIEQSAQANRWRPVCPQAKVLFALAGGVAAYLAASPAAALLLALLMAALVVGGARVPLWRYLRVLAAPLAFLALGAVSLLLSFDPETGGVRWAPGGLTPVALTLGRALAAVTALLLLALTTPLSDVVSLLRRWRVPETLIDLMVVAYRMLFVLGEAKRDIAAAQAARQGYASLSRRWRSLGILFGALAVDVWCRAADLHAAAQARNGDGPLRFLERPWPAARRELCIAALAATTLLAGVLLHRAVE